MPFMFGQNQLGFYFWCAQTKTRATIIHTADHVRFVYILIYLSKPDLTGGDSFKNFAENVAHILFIAQAILRWEK